VPGDQALADAMGIDRRRPLIVAGSTGPGEEKLLIDTCPSHAQLLLVPRKPERFAEVAALDPVMVRRSQHPDGGATRVPAENRLFLLDTMGELRKAYALADVVIVGRSFLGLYGSDMMEPVALGKPTIIGPHHSDFAHIMEALIAAGGILVTDRPGQAAAELLADPERAKAMAAAGREVIRARQGATRRHAHMLLRLLGIGS
jgi:3-deoxy-D-manno-octulosonic-acid transferase